MGCLFRRFDVSGVSNFARFNFFLIESPTACCIIGNKKKAIHFSGEEPSCCDSIKCAVKYSK